MRGSVHNCSASLTVVSLYPDISMTVWGMGMLYYMDALRDLIKDVTVAAESEPRAPE